MEYPGKNPLQNICLGERQRRASEVLTPHTSSVRIFTPSNPAALEKVCCYPRLPWALREIYASGWRLDIE
jgi:hypothetical protein